MDQEEKEKHNEEPKDTPETSEAEDIENLKAELAAARAKADTNLAGWQRAQADFINSKKRFEQEKEETIKYANGNLLLKLIPILDDFDRAMSNIPKELENSPWVKGVKLTYENMQKTLEAQGMKTIECNGAKFDPSYHEALMQSKGKEGIVIQEIQKGYMFNNRLLRPARVIVGSGEGEEANSSKEER